MKKNRRKVTNLLGVADEQISFGQIVSSVKSIKVWLVLLWAMPIAHAQSAFEISPTQAVTQSTNKVLEMIDSFSTMIKNHQYSRCDRAERN